MLEHCFLIALMLIGVEVYAMSQDREQMHNTRRLDDYLLVISVRDG